MRYKQDNIFETANIKYIIRKVLITYLYWQMLLSHFSMLNMHMPVEEAAG